MTPLRLAAAPMLSINTGCCGGLVGSKVSCRDTTLDRNGAGDRVGLVVGTDVSTISPTGAPVVGLLDVGEVVGRTVVRDMGVVGWIVGPLVVGIAVGTFVMGLLDGDFEGDSVVGLTVEG